MGKPYKVLNSWFRKTDKFGQQFSSYLKKIDDTDIFCSVCDKKISCVTKGFAALMQHVSTSLHIDAISVKWNKSQLVLKPREIDGPPISSTAVPIALNLLEDCSKTVPLNTVQLHHSKEADIKAELIWSLKSVQSNMAASTSDDLKHVFPAMFPAMAVGFSLGRTKVSYLITEALGPYFKKQLLKDVGQSYFTLVFDETTNNADKKELQFKIRYWSSEEQEIVCKHLQSVFIGHATAEDLVRELRAVLNNNNLSVLKIIMLATDGPNVNKKVWNILNNELIIERGHGLLDIGTCNLHVINNAFLKGLNEYGDSACELVTDIYYFFKKFPSRWEDFRAIQIREGLANMHFLKHVSSRWLTAGPACERLLQQWSAVETYFLRFIPENMKPVMKTAKYQNIIKYLKIVDIKVELQFVVESSGLFGAFQALFLQSQPLIHLLHNEFTGILSKIKRRICKHDTSCNDLIAVENLKGACKVDCSDKVVIALRKMKERDRIDVLFKIQRHYMIAHNYLAAQFKGSNIFKFCQCLQPGQIKHGNSLKFIGQLANILPFLEIESQSVKDEWAMLQADVLSSTDSRIDHFWRGILNKKISVKQLKYPLLNKLIKVSLCLSHGNGDVERGFSISKRIMAEDKSKMSEKMLNDRLIIKDALTKYEHVGQVPLTKELLKLAYNACRSYKNYLEEQKKQKEQDLKEKEEREEKLQKERQNEIEIGNKAASIKQLEEKAKLFAQEKKSNQESSDSLLKEANERLKVAIKKNDFAGIRVAQGMIEGAEKLRERERTVEQKETKLSSIVNKRKSNLIDNYIIKRSKNV